VKKVAFDTSVIVAALVAAHPNHARSRWWFETDRRIQRIAGLHAYAESWAVLTAMPIEPRVTGEVARAVLDRLRSVLKLVTPRPATYVAAVERCAGRGLRSGAVYDALHLVTAETERADVFLTFNEADFARLAGRAGPQIASPPDPPRLV
jgi:predicted nucleic acid-binding protein